METGTIVLVHLVNPKEKYWGALRYLGPAGVTVRGIDVDVFDDWARQTRSNRETELGLTTFFLPLHRVEKIFEDARVGAVASYQERFFEIVGREVREFLEREIPTGPTGFGPAN
jgi:hypothetical protein